MQSRYAHILFWLNLTFLGCWLQAATPDTAAGQEVDTILFNANVITVDPKTTSRKSDRDCQRKIVAVGSDTDIKSLANSKTQLVDIQGKTIAPGFIESHAPFDRDWTNAFQPGFDQGHQLGRDRAIGRGRS